MEKREVKGVLPAQLCPMKEDYSIDEGSYKAHVAYLAGIEGMGGIVANGHASEVVSLDDAERQRCLALSVEAAAGVPVYCGIFADSTQQAVREARMAQKEGAAGLLLSPASYFGLGGGALHPDMAFRYFQEVAAATDLPMILFSLPQAGGLHIPLDKILRICEGVPNIAAIKENSGDIYFYEMLYRALQQLPRKVNLLTSFSKTLVATLSIGGEGILSGAGSVISEAQIAILRAVQANDLAKARAAADQVWPLVEMFYSDPWTDMHNRMKYVSKKLGRIACETVREPLLPLSAQERSNLDQAILKSGLS